MNDRLDISEIFLKGPLNPNKKKNKTKKNKKKKKKKKTIIWFSRKPDLTFQGFND